MVCTALQHWKFYHIVLNMRIQFVPIRNDQLKAGKQSVYFVLYGIALKATFLLSLN